jgi:hypothetical protein
LTEKSSFEPKPHQVWVGKGHLGYRRSIETAGTVAAPLLAGFSFTLLVLLLPSLGEEETMVRAGQGARLITESQAFSAAPEVAAILLLLAGLLLIGTVQAAVAVRYHAHTPADYEEWYPQYFREIAAGDQPPKDLAGWTRPEAEPISVGDQWYGGWPRKHLFEQVAIANWWAAWARALYHAGILALLAGLAFLVVPPADADNAGRWVLFAVAAAGAVAEMLWILGLHFEDQLKAMHDRLRERRSASSGGAAPEEENSHSAA